MTLYKIRKQFFGYETLQFRNDQKCNNAESFTIFTTALHRKIEKKGIYQKDFGEAHLQQKTNRSIRFNGPTIIRLTSSGILDQEVMIRKEINWKLVSSYQTSHTNESLNKHFLIGKGISHTRTKVSLFKNVDEFYSGKTFCQIAEIFRNKDIRFF